jgi:lysophospholipase L1-like esterase
MGQDGIFSIVSPQTVQSFDAFVLVLGDGKNKAKEANKEIIETLTLNCVRTMTDLQIQTGVSAVICGVVPPLQCEKNDGSHDSWCHQLNQRLEALCEEHGIYYLESPAAGGSEHAIDELIDFVDSIV